MARVLGSFTIATLLTAPAPSHADFVASTGKVTLDPAAWSIGFETDASADLILYDVRFEYLTADQIAMHVRHAPDEVIEGDQALEFGGDLPFGYVRLDRASMSGHRIEVRLWQKALGTEATIALEWYSGTSLESSITLGEIAFQPTGRATDDGWAEWSSGLVDAALGGMIQPIYLQIYDQQYPTASQRQSGYDLGARVLLDAITIIDHGPALVPTASCTLPTERTACGADGACMYGRCVDAAAAIGPWLEHPVARADYLARRSFEFSQFEGGRLPHQQLSQVNAVFTQMMTAPNRVDYWTLFVRAIGLLGDGHASHAVSSSAGRIYAGVCIYQGLADLLPGGGQAPMVFDARPANPIASLLHPGDVLTAIDGLPVDVWSASAERFLEYSGDPGGRSIITTPQIFDAALRTGATLTFSRCALTSSTSTAGSPPPRPCTAGEVETIEIDLGSASAGVWTNAPPSWLNDFVGCDFRFNRLVDDTSRGREYDFAGFADTQGVRALQINGVPDVSQSPAWGTSVENALSSGPQKLIFDQRQGFGGSVASVDLIAGYLLDPTDSWGAEFIPAIDAPLSAGLRTALRDCANQRVTLTTGSCGNFFPFQIGSTHSADGASSHTRVAVLNGLDVSGNDYTSQFLSLRRVGQTRIFAPGPTYGAFGVIWQLPAYGPEVTGGSFQVHDTVFLSGAEDMSEDFRTTHGIAPDEVVLERQRDAVRGIDTTLTAALAWLNQ